MSVNVIALQPLLKTQVLNNLRKICVHFNLCIIIIKQKKIQHLLPMLSRLARKNSIKKVLKWVFSGLGIFFISMLIFILMSLQCIHEHFQWIFLVKKLCIRDIRDSIGHLLIECIRWAKLKHGYQIGLRGYTIVNNTNPNVDTIIYFLIQSYIFFLGEFILIMRMWRKQGLSYYFKDSYMF